MSKKLINLSNKNFAIDYMKRHVNDSFVKLSKEQNYRCRSAFKLIEINNKYRIIKPNQTILDAGAAPGGWSQVLLQYSKSNNKIFAVDLLKFNPIPGVVCIQGDITDKDLVMKINQQINFSNFDLICSDACPEFKGIRDVDMINSNNLNKKIISLASKFLKLNGNLVFKVFDNKDLDNVLNMVNNQFDKVHKHKPLSSRSESSENYVVCIGYNGLNSIL